MNVRKYIERIADEEGLKNLDSAASFSPRKSRTKDGRIGYEIRFKWMAK